MNHNEANKSKKEILKSYTDYSAQKGTRAKIEQYKKLLDFLIMDCRDLMVEEIRRGGSIHEDDLTEDRIEEELEEELENLEYKKPEVSPCDNEELSKLYAYDHGLIIPDELKSLYEEIGFFSIGDDPAGLYMFNPKRVLFAKDFNTFVPDADYFNGFKDYIDKDRCDFLSQNYCFIGTSRRFMEHAYILFEKSGRGFITLTLEEDDLSETMDRDVELLCNPETATFYSLDEALAQGFHEATDGLLHDMGLIRD